MKIVCLAENTSINENIGAEHGLSLYIEANTQKVLFDMGQTNLFAKNAKTLGVDLSKVDFAVLSHGHYDHGGGLEEFFNINKTAPVYINRNAFLDYYNGNEKYIGLDKTLRENERIIFCDDTAKIKQGFTLYSCNQKEKEYNLGSFGLTVKQGSSFLPDPFLHEQYLLIEEQEKRVLISGCSHKGILNIANWFEPDVLVGGFHFSKLALDKRLAEYARLLEAHNTSYYTCHCTGTEQFDYMKKYMSRLFYLSCSQTIEI